MTKTKNKFGLLKTKILDSLTEAYINGNKGDVKRILKLIKENKDFKELYLFYDDIETMYIDNEETAKIYVEHVESLLSEKVNKVSSYCKVLSKELPNDVLEETEIYSNLDQLAEESSLKNVDKKIMARKKLVEHLTTKKEESAPAKAFTTNESLLHLVLVNNFNEEFENSLSEEEKKELKKLLTVTNEEIKTNFPELKESVQARIEELLSEETDDNLKLKLSEALSESRRMDPTKYNYYKLQQLKNGL